MQQIISETTAQTPVFVGKEFKRNGNQEPAPFRWTKEEYHKMAELGMFQGRRTEFIEGEIIEIPPMKSPHATSLSVAYDTIKEVFTNDFHIRSQTPLDLDKEIEVEPDVFVLKGNARDYNDSLPKTAELIIEISDTTLSYDRNRKSEPLCEVRH